MTRTPEQEANLQRWLTTLRSGEYRQLTDGRFGSFDDSKAACAIGVAVYTLGKSPFSGVSFYRLTKALGVTPQLLAQVMTWNDDDRIGFYTIADRIEAALKREPEHG